MHLSFSGIEGNITDSYLGGTQRMQIMKDIAPEHDKTYIQLIR